MVNSSILELLSSLPQPTSTFISLTKRTCWNVDLLQDEEFLLFIIIAIPLLNITHPMRMWATHRRTPRGNGTAIQRAKTWKSLMILTCENFPCQTPSCLRKIAIWKVGRCRTKWLAITRWFTVWWTSIPEPPFQLAHSHKFYWKIKWATLMNWKSCQFYVCHVNAWEKFSCLAVWMN